MILVVEQVLNGVQLGVMLFLMAAGLTLIFGIMNVINLAHGSLYMVGAYVAAAAFAATGSFLLGARRRARGGDRGRPRARDRRLPHALRARPSRPGAGDLRPDPVLQRGGAHAVGLDRALHAGARFPERPGRAAARRALSGLPAGDHRGRARGRAGAVPADRAHPARHADPRRRRQPGHARRARGQCDGCSTRWSSCSGRRWRRLPGSWPGRSSRSNPAWARAS